MLVLPPSFPYGGMENPRLTFLTPTFIAGDRSLVSLLAHELAHSWSGNLVTNAVWADFWLNEGYNFVHRKPHQRRALRRRADQHGPHCSTGPASRRRCAKSRPPSTRLHLSGDYGPDDGVSAIVYDKGALFFRTIEREIGRERLDAYLRSYFDRHAFQPITSAEFLADFREHVVQGDAALEQRLMLDQWVYQPGLPSNAQEPRAAAFDRVAEVVRAYNAGGPASAVPWSSWGTLERQRFLQSLPRQQSTARLTQLEGPLQLNATHNSEVLFDWLKLAVANRYEPAMPALELFLTRQGRGKFIRPLYRDLMGQGEWGQAHARRIYATARAGYHPVVSTDVDVIVRG